MKHVMFAAVLCMACAAEADGDDFDLVSNRYDHLGRRVQKITPEATHTYFYDGWLLVKEVVERSGDTRRCGVSPRHCGGAGSSTSLGEDAAGSRVSIEEDVIEYHWGKDLSGTIGGAGGVGGLLYVKINGDGGLGYAQM